MNKRSVFVVLLLTVSCFVFPLPFSMNVGAKLGGMMFADLDTWSVCGSYYAEAEAYHLIIGLEGMYFPQEVPFPYSLEGFTPPFPYIGASFDTLGVKTILTVFPLIPQSTSEGSLIAVMTLGIRAGIMEGLYLSGELRGLVNFKEMNLDLPGAFVGAGYTF